MRIDRTAAIVIGALALTLTGCGGSKTQTVTETRTITPTAADTPEEAAQPQQPISLTRAAHLAADNVHPDEIIVKQAGAANRGPYTFKPGTYRVRFQQWAGREDGNINFATEASSLVVQLDRRPGDITGETVTVFNVTKEHGSNLITVPGGRFYVDVSSEDYGVVLRFTPQP